MIRKSRIHRSLLNYSETFFSWEQTNLRKFQQTLKDYCFARFAPYRIFGIMVVKITEESGVMSFFNSFNKYLLHFYYVTENQVV